MLPLIYQNFNLTLHTYGKGIEPDRFYALSHTALIFLYTASDKFQRTFRNAVIVILS